MIKSVFIVFILDYCQSDPSRLSHIEVKYELRRTFALSTFLASHNLDNQHRGMSDKEQNCIAFVSLFLQRERFGEVRNY